MGPLRGNRGRSRADPRRILALSCLSALHNIETTLRSVVPPAAGLHTYTWCTTSARNPLAPSLPLSFSPPPSSFISFPSPLFRNLFHRPLWPDLSVSVPRRAFCPVPFSSLTTIFAFVGRKRGRWMNRRRAQGRGASRRRTPATGFGGQTGDRVSRESRSTIHFYPALFFLFLSFLLFYLSSFLSLPYNLAVQRGANQNTLDPDLPTIIRGRGEGEETKAKSELETKGMQFEIEIIGTLLLRRSLMYLSLFTYEY